MTLVFVFHRVLIEGSHHTKVFSKPLQTSRNGNQQNLSLIISLLNQFSAMVKLVLQVQFMVLYILFSLFGSVSQFRQMSLRIGLNRTLATLESIDSVILFNT